MNPEDPKDIKCPQCEHRMPLDVDIDQLTEVICDQCKTVIENIENHIVPSSSPVSALPNKQEPEIGITVEDLIKDNAPENSDAGTTTHTTGAENSDQIKKDLNLDITEFIQSDVGDSRGDNKKTAPDFTKFTKTDDLEYDEEFVARQKELAHEFAVAQSEIVTWDESHTQKDEGPKKITKVRVIQLIALSVALITGVYLIAFKGNQKSQNNNLVFQFDEENETEKKSNKESETISELLIEIGAKELHSRATTALKNFLDAKDVKSRIQYCRDSQRVQPLMESYYSKHDSGPISYRRFSTVGDAETGPLQGFYLLKISFPDFSIQPVVMGLENGKMVIDWESFVGYSEMSLSEFINNKPKEPTMFRLHARPDDYFNFQFNEKEHRCLYLRNPTDTESVYGYIKKGEPVDDKLSRIAESGKSINFIIVNLQYPDKPGGKNQVIINDIIASGWLLNQNN
ncbi:MAG: hypothetical protein MK172_10220 [Verrucomicrobiales bacterium]|nr:hypothetical protein [Verrucomicrobiales bacterium]